MADPGKEETPDPGTATRDGRRAPGVHEDYLLRCAPRVQSKKINLRVDRMAGWLQVSLSTPAGPLSQDMLSLGGFSFFRGDVS